MTTIILATRNRHKVQEIQSILGDAYFYRDLSELPGAPTVVEDQLTFGGNATKKAVTLAQWWSTSGSAQGLKGEIWVLADDSGLEVDALHGAPGVHSARFAAMDAGQAGNSSDAENNAKLLRLLEKVPASRRTGRFRCTIALAPVLPVQIRLASGPCSADERELQTQLFDGVCQGRLDTAPQGQGGFGYDPLFVPEGYSQSFAELSAEEKNRLSHRAQALQKLQAWFAQRG